MPIRQTLAHLFPRFCSDGEPRRAPSLSPCNTLALPMGRALACAFAGGIYLYPEDIYCCFALAGLLKVAKFHKAGTSVNKRLYVMFQSPRTGLCREHNSLPLPRTCALVRKGTTKSARIQILEKLLWVIAVNIRVLPDNSKSQAAILFGQPQKKEK